MSRHLWGEPWTPPEPEEWWVKLIALAGVLLTGWSIWNGIKLVAGLF